MMEQSVLIGVFSHFSKDVQTPGYYFVSIFDHEGIVDQENLEEVFEEFVSDVPESHKDLIGPFENLEQLNQYAFKLCELKNAVKINLFSDEEFNALTEEITSIDDLARELCQSGHVLENIDHKSKKGFFKKFF